MKQIIFTILILIYGVLSLGATELQVYTQDKPNIVLSPDHNEFVIKLKSNPSTGYSWFLRDFNVGTIIPVKHSYQAGNSKIPGAPGYELWFFKVKAEGFTVPQQMVIKFVYSRPWSSTESTTLTNFRISLLPN